MSSKNDKRSGARYLPIFELRVLEMETGQDLGLLVEASPEGLRIASPTPLECGRQLRLSIEAGPEESGSAALTCDATVRWCQSSENYPSLNIVGLELGKFDSMQSENEHLRMLLSECVPTAA